MNCNLTPGLKFQSNQIQTRLLNVVILLFTCSSIVFGQSGDTLTRQQSVKQEEVFEKVDVKPSIEYSAWRQHFEGQLQGILDSSAVLGIPAGKYTVKVRFIVEKDGSITNVKAIDDPDYFLGKGAEQVLLTSPKWTPAKKKGKKVRSYYIQPIVFMISEE